MLETKNRRRRLKKSIVPSIDGKALLFAAVAPLFIAGAANATVYTWAGSNDGTPADDASINNNWATGANWGGTAPVAVDQVIFGSANASPSTTLTNTLSLGTLPGAGLTRITFNAGAPAYTMTGNTFGIITQVINSSTATQVFSNTGGVATIGATVTFSLVNGGITITNGIYSTRAGPQIISVAGTGNTLTVGGYDLNSASNNARADSFTGTGNVIINGAIKATGGATALTSSLTYNGTGTLTLSGSTVSTYTGATTVSSGSLVLDFANAVTPTGGLLASTTALTLGGNLVVKGKTGGGVTSAQTLGNLTIGAGTVSTITLNNNSGAGTTLTLGSTWTRATGAGSATNIDLSLGGTITSAPTMTGSVVTGTGTGAFATVTDSTGSGFATVVGGNVVRLTGQAGLLTSGNVSTTDYTYAATGATYTLAGSQTVNTLDIQTGSNAGTLDLGGGTLGLTAQAILMSGANNFTFQNGQIGAANTELLIHAMGPGTLTVSGTLGSGSANVVKSGLGTFNLTGTNGYTGSTLIGAGKLAVSSAGSINGTSGITINGGEFNYTSSVALTQGITFTRGILSGTGKVSAVSAGAGTTITPGSTSASNTIGTLSTGNLALAAGSIYAADIDTSTPTSDTINVTGTVTLGGTLTLNVSGDKTLLLNKTVVLIVNDGSDLITTNFSSTNLNSLFGGILNTSLVYNYNADAGSVGNDVAISFTTIPEPASMSLITLGGAGLLRRRRRYAARLAT